MTDADEAPVGGGRIDRELSLIVDALQSVEDQVADIRQRVAEIAIRQREQREQ